ncbi:MAG: hypothetical protein AB1505_10360, partial [Candidatus Latescibacterota bacterium]
MDLRVGVGRGVALAALAAYAAVPYRLWNGGWQPADLVGSVAALAALLLAGWGLAGLRPSRQSAASRGLV